jgi:N-acyl-D-amino-acid deacylase
MLRVVLLSLFALSLPAADFDIVIRNARLVDGTGNPWFRADVGVRDGKIAAIGALSKASADKVIDANNRVLAPGFIDVHTHIEGGIEKVPRADNYILDGVTTVVTGNCGGSEINLGDWFKNLEQLGLGINVASLIGHNSVRQEVMGTANRKATPEEIEKMQALVEKGMRDGAVGFSTGLIYIPGTYSDTAEVVALAKAAAKFGGVYASHMRDEGVHVIDAINEAVTVGKESGLRVELSHSKSTTRSCGDRATNHWHWWRSTGVKAWMWWWISIRTTGRVRILESCCRVGRWPMARKRFRNA